MTADEMRRRLEAAADEAIAFARTCVVDRIPDARLFDVFVKPHSDGRVDDPPLEEARLRGVRGLLRALPAERVVEELWHEGRVPEWIDISVAEVGAPPDDAWNLVTFVELHCSRTLATDEGLWYANAGNPPFHVLGPAMPHDHVGDRKFMLQRSGRGLRGRR